MKTRRLGSTILLASVLGGYGTAALAVPTACTGQHNTVKIFLTLGSDGKPRDPGATQISGKPANIVWYAPNGWRFDPGAVTINNSGSEFSQGHTGKGNSPGGANNHNYHFCDQNDDTTTYKYNVTLFKATEPNNLVTIDPALVNDGDPIIKKKRSRKSKAK